MKPLSHRERLVHLSDGTLRGYHLDEIEKYIELYARGQVEEVLDRLEDSNKRLGDIDSHTEAWGIPLSAIEAERNKLKGSSND